MTPDLSAVIVSYNTRAYLQRCLADLFAVARIDRVTVEVIVVDNGSTDGSLELLEAHQPPVLVVRNERNVGFAAANNQGLERASAPFALLLNSDAFVPAGCLRRALDVLRHDPDIGIAGVRLVNADGSHQAGPGHFPSLWDDVRASLGLDQVGNRPADAPLEPGPVDWVQGACMFARMAAVRAVGGLDTRFFMYSEEIDWCRRFRDGGWGVWYLPDVAVTHVGGGSSHGNDTARRIALYRSRVGFRRRLGGPLPSALLWLAIVAGLALRIPARWFAQRVARRSIGRQTPSTDLELLWAMLRTDPLARWAVSQAI